MLPLPPGKALQSGTWIAQTEIEEMWLLRITMIVSEYRSLGLHAVGV